jgi:hypothetical protein
MPTRRHSLAVVLVIVLVALAGCTGVLDRFSSETPEPTAADSEATQSTSTGTNGSTQSVSTASGSDSDRSGPSVRTLQVLLVDDTPTLRFEYATDGSATALLRDPNDDVVTRVAVTSGEGVAGLAMETLEPGEYDVLLQRDGDTVASDSLTVDSGEPSVRDVALNRSDDAFKSATITVYNAGAVPVEVVNATVETPNATVGSATVSAWVPARDTATVTVTATAERLSIDGDGDVHGTATVGTPGESVSDAFRASVDGANLEITKADQTWDGNTLRTVNVTVENTGDAATNARVAIRGNDTDLWSLPAREIPAGESERFTLGAYGYVYRPTSGGTVRLAVVANGTSDRDRMAVSHYVEPATLSVDSVSTTWQVGALETVSYTVTNTGEVGDDFTARVAVGETRVGNATETIGPNVTTSFTYGEILPGDLYTAESGGTYPVTVTIVDGNTSATELTNYTGAVAEFSRTDATFDDTPDDRATLSDLSFRVRNSGDLPLTYDRVAVRINGTNHTAVLDSSETVGAGTYTDDRVDITDGPTVSTGEYDLTIRLRNGTRVVGTTNVTVSTGT